MRAGHAQSFPSPGAAAPGTAALGPPPFPWQRPGLGQRPPREAASAACPGSMEDEEEQEEGEEKEEDEEKEKEDEVKEKEDEVRGRPSAPPVCGWTSVSVVLSPSLSGAAALSPDGGTLQGGPLSPL